MNQRLAYTHNNPVEAGFVDEPRHGPGTVAEAMKQGLRTLYHLYYTQ